MMTHLLALLWSLCPAAAVRFSTTPLVLSTSDGISVWGSTSDVISVWGTATTTTTTATSSMAVEQLRLDMTVDNIGYAELIFNIRVFQAFVTRIRQVIADLAGHHISPENVEVKVSAGSVRVMVTVSCPPGIAVADVLATLAEAPLETAIAKALAQVPGLSEIATGPIGVSGVALELLATTTKTATTTTITGTTAHTVVSSYGDPHSRNVHGQRFDIRRPGNHSFLVLPRGASRGQAKLHVEARVTPRGGLCSGLLYVTGLKLAGRWLEALGGEIELYTATEKFNSPEAVGLKVGNSSNMSLQAFVARIPKHQLRVSQYSPELPAKLNTHVNTLLLNIHAGPVLMKVGWSHEKLEDGYANWLWLEATGLGTAQEVGGLLGSDDNTAAQQPSADVLAACQAHRQHGERPQDPAQAAGRTAKRPRFRSWASAEW